MTAIETQEQVNLFINGLENGEIHFISRNLTEEDREEISRELAKLKAERQKNKEPVFA